MRTLTLLALALAAAAAAAQSPMGTIATRDAKLSGTLNVQADHAILLSNVSITAGDHTAPIALTRGGEALVCSTSQFHLLHAGAGKALLFGLDRGAVELHTRTEPQDVILTPDIRFSVEHPGQLDLRLRVTPDGDTCVDNRSANAGPTAPVLFLSGSFTGASYRLLPGQHVLFEHGDLRAVVDNERSNCGCPSDSKQTGPHPFPEAASEGLTAPPTTPITVPANSVVLSTNPAATATPIPLAAESQTAPTPTQPHGFFHAIGHFFRHLFGDDSN